MIEVTILYPSTPGGRFDHAYYERQHIPMSVALLGDAVKGVAVTRGVDAGPPWAQPAYVAICRFSCESVEAYLQALAPHVERLQADMANYCDTPPVIQICEVTVRMGA